MPKKVIAILTIPVVLSLNCTSLKLLDPQNDSIVIMGITTIANTGFGIIKQQHSGGILHLVNILDGTKYVSKYLSNEYLVVTNVKKGSYSIQKLFIDLGQFKETCSKHQLSLNCNKIKIDKPGVYFIGNYDVNGKIHGICCDTFNIRFKNNKLKNEIINKIEKSNSNSSIPIYENQRAFLNDQVEIYNPE